MKVTIKDIAREAGVSVSTVSYVLNKSGRIVKDSHKRIFELVKKYNYVPDAYAKGLVTGISNNIGLIIGEAADITFSQPFMINCLKELNKEISKFFGWLSLCIPPDCDIRTLKQYLSNTKVDGLILMYTVLSDEILQLLDARGIPHVYFGVYKNTNDTNGSIIGCDDYKGITMAFEHLTGLGNKKIMFISGEPENEPDIDNSLLDPRYSAYNDAVIKKAFSYKSIIYSSYTEVAAYVDMKNYIESGNAIPEAIITGNDTIAYGAMKALNEKGFRVPQDISVVGYDDANLSYNEGIGLTTIRQPIADMMKASVDYIYKCVGEGKKDIYNFKFKPELIIRKSTCKK